MNNEQFILQERARKAAGFKTPVTATGESLLVVELELIPEHYGIPASFIAEILPVKEITAIPGTPLFVMGVMNFRGKIISVVNLKSFFNLNAVGISQLNKVIVIQHGQMEFGILADNIFGVLNLRLSDIHTPPATVNGIGAEFITGVHADGLILLNIDNIVASSSLIINQK